MQPFIHKFETKNAYYIYDVNTNQILKVDRIIYDIVDEAGILPQENIAEKWKDIYSKNETKKALSTIKIYQKKGYFSQNHPSKLFPSARKECLQKLIDSKLKQLILNISERCNLRCKYCVYSGLYPYERTHSNSTMGNTMMLKTISYFLNHSKESKHVDISFYGGEPLTTWNKIKEAIEFIKNRTKHRKVNFHIDTNGTLLTNEKLIFIIKNKILLQISLDGPQLLNDRYRVFPDGTGSFNIIVQNIKRLRKLDKDYYKTYVAFAVTLAPPYELLKVNAFFNTEMFAEHPIAPTFVDSFDTQFFEKFRQDSNDDLLQDIEELKTNYITSRVNGTEPSGLEKGFFERPLIRIHKRKLQPLGEEAPPNGICVPGVQRLFVTAEGKFYPCERVGNAFYLGNVASGLEERKMLNTINHYKEVSTPDCIQCWAVRLCKLCFASARKGNELNLDRKKRNCLIERKNLHEALVTYSKISEQNSHAFDFVKKMIFT